MVTVAYKTVFIVTHVNTYMYTSGEKMMITCQKVMVKC